MKACYLQVLISLFAICSLSSAQGQDGTQAQRLITWGYAVNGLQMAIHQDQGFQGADREMHLMVEFRNVGQNDETFTTGGGGCGILLSDATSYVKLNLTDPQGTRRRLPFVGPPYQWSCAGASVGPKLVMLHPGESVSMPLFIGKYVDLSDSKVPGTDRRYRYPPGVYSLQAELTNSIRNVLPHANWTGTLQSNSLPIHFESEFSSLLGN
jgi:hypothetical protein